jgi:hypothetical protein
MPVILATQEKEIRRIAFLSQPQQIVQETLSRKYLTQKRAGRVAQVAVCPPSKHEALGSNKKKPTCGLRGLYFNYSYRAGSGVLV